MHELLNIFFSVALGGKHAEHKKRHVLCIRKTELKGKAAPYWLPETIGEKQVNQHFIERRPKFQVIAE